MLQEFVPAEVYAFLMVFVRLGTIMITMPAIGETFISPRFRLVLALLTAAILAPVLGPTLPPPPDTVALLALFLFSEILIGIFIGLIFRFMVVALATAGSLVAFTTGFAAAQMFNPAVQGAGTLHSVFYSLLGTLLILTANLHHAMFYAVVDSYELMPPGGEVYLGDMAETMTRVLADSFALGFQLATPFILFVLMFNVLLGLLARLMPQMQVFFIGQPLQLELGNIIWIITLPGAMYWFLEKFSESVLIFRVQ